MRAVSLSLLRSALRFTVLVALALAGCSEQMLPPIDQPDMVTPGRCSSDSQCAVPTPRCDKNSMRCVACLPESDDCPRGQRCVLTNGTYACSATCVTDADCPRSDAGSPTTCCSGACIDTGSDILSCGRCGAVCPTPQNGTAGCSGGLCGVGACNAGFLDCDRASNNGCEVNANSDGRNCGACGTVCTAGANQSAACTDGTCTASCIAGFADCDGNPRSGCEVSTDTDGKNCGACGTVCALSNASSVCRAGACAVSACSAGFDDCNADPKDGCESDLKQDVQHCGNCLNACAVANAVPVCRLGACGVASCIMGFANCDSLVINGCEISLKDDNKNCGACGTKCVGANSVQSCANFVCAINGCTPDYADCDGKPESGCEINVATDAMNCGGCGKACPVPANGGAACINGRCGIGQCKFGFYDCNNDPKDGCEIDLLTVNNCGNCGVVCAPPPNASAGCNGGVCGVGKCNALFGDCDGVAQNGCEKSVAADVMNCGKCGAVCSVPNAQPACVGGQCGFVACNAGFGDCDKVPGNGCEVSLASDAKNCGGCGIVCPNFTPYCAGGKCTNSVHNTVKWPAGPYIASNSCSEIVNGVRIGAFEAINLGQYTWKDCLIEASKRGAIVATPTYGAWPQPGWWSVRAPNSNLAMTGQWANYIAADINTKQTCNLMREPQAVALGQWNSKGLLANTVVYDGNTWRYQDFGVMFVDQCLLLAGQYGATLITPFTIGLPNGDNYWQGVLHTCSVYSWSANNGTSFGYDNSINRISQKACMIGWIEN